ncbi:hypothetical protein AB0D67_36360 [Streptosporangium sp. NPDC048047]|uniref:hypothetical protein n=1 Tax=Streptosporangium sp. NPDC048047 TaxID=3155748 RepID=UPI003431DF9F
MIRSLALLTAALPLLTSVAPASAAGPAVPHVPAGVAAGYAVFDRQTGRLTAHRDVHRRFRSASVVKIMIAIDHLESHRKVPDRDLALLKVMLRVSDDDAASAFWDRGGKGKIVERIARRLGLTDTAPPPADRPGFWGYTSLSALDMVRVYRYLLDRAEPRVSELILGHLRQAGPCGSDGFDQYFGIPRGVARPWAVKQGWSGYGLRPPVRCRPSSPGTPGTPSLPASSAAVPSPAASGRTTAAASGRTTAAASGRTAGAPAPAGPLSGVPVPVAPADAAAPAAPGSAPRVVPDYGRPVLHTTGLVGPKDRWIIVLLTAYPAGTSWQRSTSQITRLAREVHRSGTA